MAGFRIGDLVRVDGMGDDWGGVEDFNWRLDRPYKVVFPHGRAYWFREDELEPVRHVGYVATGKESETIVTDEATGGSKAEKLAQLGGIDPAALYTLAEVAGMGAGKYDRFNYVKGYKWSLSVDAAYRHFLKFQMGEDTDPESGLPHLAHAAWHMLCLLTFQQRSVGTDDRIGKE